MGLRRTRRARSRAPRSTGHVDRRTAQSAQKRHVGLRMTRRMLLLAGAAALVLTTNTAQAQTVNLWPGPAPGSEHWTQKEQTLENTPIGTVVINVVTPTLTAYLPDKAKASGSAVI